MAKEKRRGRSPPVQVGHDVVPVTQLWLLGLPVALHVLEKEFINQTKKYFKRRENFVVHKVEKLKLPRGKK